MKHTLTIVLFAFFVQANAQTMNVFIIAGQSNAVGQGNTALLPVEYNKIPNAFIYNEGAGIVALNPLTCLGAGHGIELSFAAEMLGLVTGPVCIIKVAQNGSSMVDPNPVGPYGTWSPFANEGLFSQLVSSTEEAMSALVAEGYQPQLRGMVWWQGESDAHSSGVGYQGYLTLSQVFMEALRVELQSPGIPVCIVRCGLNIGSGWLAQFPFMSQIRQDQVTLGSLSHNCWIDVDALYAGDIHPGSASLVSVGIMAANALWSEGLGTPTLVVTEPMMDTVRAVGVYRVIDMQGRTVLAGSRGIGRTVGDVRNTLLNSALAPGTYVFHSQSLRFTIVIPSK